MVILQQNVTGSLNRLLDEYCEPGKMSWNCVSVLSCLVCYCRIVVLSVKQISKSVLNPDEYEVQKMKQSLVSEFSRSTTNRGGNGQTSRKCTRAAFVCF